MNKKTYSKPIIETHKIDKETSIMMSSLPDDNNVLLEQPKNTSEEKTLSDNPFDDNPWN